MAEIWKSRVNAKIEVRQAVNKHPGQQDIFGKEEQ